MRKILCGLLLTAMTGMPFYPAWGQSLDGKEEFSWLSQAPDMADTQRNATYRKYFYNHPHSLPLDYVYRTGRVFIPGQSRRFRPWDIFSAFTGGEGQAPGSSRTAGGNGLSLQNDIEQLVLDLVTNTAEDITDEYVVTVSTFVNLNNLYRTSSFGRFISEQMISELQAAGMEIIDVRKTPAIMISKGGEYGLSRDMDELSFVHAAQAMVVGTYTFVEDRIFINARLLRNDDSRVLASASSVIAMDSLTFAMLMDEKVSAQPRLETGREIVQIRSLDE